MVTDVSSKQSQEVQRPLMKDLFVEGTELGNLSSYYGEGNENVTKTIGFNEEKKNSARALKTFGTFLRRTTPNSNLK